MLHNSSNFKSLNIACIVTLTFLSSSTRGGSMPQVMSCWICWQGPAAMLDNAHAASFCTLAFGCLISWGRMFRTPASIAVWVCTSEPLTMFPMERRAGVWRLRQSEATRINSQVSAWQSDLRLLRKSPWWMRQIWSEVQDWPTFVLVFKFLYTRARHRLWTQMVLIKIRLCCVFENTLTGFNETKLPWHWAHCGSWAPPAEGRCQFSPQHQYGHYHRLWGRRLPSMHQTRCPYRRDGETGSEKEAPEGKRT